MSRADETAARATSISYMILDHTDASMMPAIAGAGQSGLDAMVVVIESCRSYLLLVAERAMAPDLRAKEAASDLVQEAMVEAQREAGRWTGRAEANDELRAWLRQFLMHKIAHAARRYRQTGKRRIGREIPMATAGNDRLMAETLIDDQTSAGARAVRREEEAALRTALDRLPERMRRAVLWRHHEECSFEEIGRRLGCSNVAARKVWLKALQRLQDELKERAIPET